MRRGLPVWALLATFASTPARATAPAQAGFYAAGALQPIFVETDSVVVRAVTRSHRPDAARTPEAAAAFAQLGAVSVPRAAVAAADEILGYPASFDAAGRVAAILTHEIVVRGDETARDGGDERVLAAVRSTAGFAGLAETPFRRHLFRVRYTSPMAALAAANALHDAKGVRYAHPNFLLPKDFRGSPTAEPLYQSQWHLGAIGAPAAWDLTQGDPQVVVAVLDGGFEATHPDLRLDLVHGWNFKTGTGDLAAGADEDHGTAVAGLVGAPVNGVGVTGVCPLCTVLPLVVAWTPVDDAAAFHYAVQHGAWVISNSWGYPVGTPTTDVVAEAIRDAATTGRGGKGVPVLFAMNNLDQNDCQGKTPDISSLPSVVAVSAANDLDEKVRGSAWGPCLKLLAPSFEEGRPGITTTDVTGSRGYNNGHMPHELPDLDYTNAFGGTSAATPIAAGVLGLMLSVNPKLTRDEAVSLLLAAAAKVHPELAGYDPATGFSDHYGFGRVDAARAVQAAQSFQRFSRQARPGTRAGRLF